jgi:hypothetical protein
MQISYRKAYAMQIVKHFPPSVPAHRTDETESAAWVMIVILVGLVSFAIVSLLDRIGG